MKVYSQDAHPIAKATITLVHDTNQALSGLWSIKKQAEKDGNTKLVQQLEVVEKRIKSPVDVFYKLISDHAELPQ